MANAEVAEDPEHPRAEESTDAVGITASSESAVAREESPAPKPTVASEGIVGPDAPPPDRTPVLRAPTTRRLTFNARILRAVVLPLVGMALLAPVVIAVLIFLAAVIVDVAAVVTVARLLLLGQLLLAEPALNIFLSASRIGFLALGYLGLFTALISLANGLLARGPGRLFIIPGIILTGSALVLFAASLILATPLLESLHVSHRLLVAVALVFAVDAAALATFLTDTRDTRRRWSRRNRLSQTQPPPGERPQPSPETRQQEE